MTKDKKMTGDVISARYTISRGVAAIKKTLSMAEQQYTIADVASRDGRGNAPVWMIYRDSVYDVTSYISQHPGGDVILEEAGKDATKAFDEADHSSDARQIFKKYKIGEIIEEEKKYDANGKKKKRVVAARPEPSRRGCLSAICCRLAG